MKRRDKKESISLLETPNEETQAKAPVKVAIHVCVILVLFCIMFCSFLVSFSGNTCFSFKSQLYQGTFSAEKYYDTKDWSLIVADPVDEKSTLVVGDEILFSSSSESGSAVLKNIDGDVLQLERENGTIFSINRKHALGVVKEKKPVVGGFLAFFQTSVGGIVSMVILLVYTVCLSFSKINFENTEDGKRLLRLYKKKKKEDAEQKKILRTMKNVEGVDQEIVEMLSGTFRENKKQFAEFKKDKFPSETKKYEYVLFRLHEVLIVKEELSRQERMCVTSILELLGETTSINQNVEYMLVDLLLKGPLVDFDEKVFESNMSVFLSKKIEGQDLLNLGSILYVLFKKNTKIRNKVATDILLEYSKKSEEMGKSTQELAKNISLNIANYIK